MSRNFGIGSRDMGRAAEMVLREAQQKGELSFSSVATHSDRFDRFVSHCRENGINRMENITRETVAAYGQTLSERGYSASYAQNSVSSVNTVMSRASGGRWESVSPTKDAGIEARSNVREAAPASLDRQTASQAVAAAASVSERCGAMAECSREFGLRSEEAAKFDAKGALSEYRETGSITISEGTKGGQSRELEVRTEAQVSSLERAAGAQGEARSMIPPDQSYSQFREGEMREAREAMQGEGLSGWHDLRAGFACERYEELTGCAAPCAAGEMVADREADHAARSEIGEELGHHREDVLVAYVGSAQ